VHRAASSALLVLCAALLVTVGVGSSIDFAKDKKPRPYRIIPGPYDKKRVADERTPTTSQFNVKGLTVWVQPLDREARAEFVESMRPGMADPFAVRLGRPEQYMAFRVLFDNESGSLVTFQPGNVILVTNRQDHRFPLDITDLYMQANRAGVDDPQRTANEVMPLMFDSSTTIPNGRQMERLLVFKALTEDMKWKELALHFSFLQIDSDTHSLSFVYHKQVEKD
jgi:hypothetical protein